MRQSLLDGFSLEPFVPNHILVLASAPATTWSGKHLKKERLICKELCELSHLV